MRPLHSLLLACPFLVFLTGCFSHHSTSYPGSYSGVAKSPIVEAPRLFSRAPATTVALRDSQAAPHPAPADRERYDDLDENPFVPVSDEPRSTFSIDVDTASYANVRRLIEEKRKVPGSAVRVEEMVNYFDYDYPAPTGEKPFSVADEVSTCPWKPDHRLVRVALQGREIEDGAAGPVNLVFLVDVSGSMEAPNKLPLLRESLALLVRELDADDRVAIVTYAGNAGLALPSTRCSESGKILAALKRLSAGGSTAGGAGIERAYDVAKTHFVADGVNRVVLATDGDFNVGVSSDGELVDLIEEKAKSGIQLSVLGFGMGNYNDSMLEKLSGKGNGNYAYIDTIREAKKVLVRQRHGSLVTIAKDVKLQVEFNPARVRAWRLIGYENRALEDRDFADDSKDAGEMGAGHQVTAFYEVVPAGADFEQPAIEELRYQRVRSEETSEAQSDELMAVKVRYKPPTASRSRIYRHEVSDSEMDFKNASGDFRFAASVAAFGMLLKDSEHSGRARRRDVFAWARSGKGTDPHGYRAEFLDLVRDAKML